MASPHCRVSVSRIGRIGEVGRCPFIRYWSIPATAVEWAQDLIGGIKVGAAPDNHFAPSPHRRVSESAIWRVSSAGNCPIVCCGIISTAGAIVSPTPHDHFRASPHCRMCRSARWRARGTSGCPAVCVRIVSATGVQVNLRVIVITSPNDHFAATPYRGMSLSCKGDIGGTDGCPRVQCGIV
jgi:hypothetical protein